MHDNSYGQEVGRIHLRVRSGPHIERYAGHVAISLGLHSEVTRMRHEPCAC
jgi:hypothetical protein